MSNNLSETCETAVDLSTARPINCDQVAWMLSAIDRYLPQDKHPSVSRSREMQKYALLYELMDVANLAFADETAQFNGTPHDVRRFLTSRKVQLQPSEGSKTPTNTTEN